MYATDGDDSLGGSDIDLCMFKILKDRILEVSGTDITTLTATGERDVGLVLFGFVSYEPCIE